MMLEKTAGNIIIKSSVFETEPWGFTGVNYFLNIAVILNTALKPEELLSVTNSIENNLGRERTNAGYTSRTIDIDILFYGDLLIQKQDLIIPHPLLHKRLFVLIPLNEIHPDLVHPVYKKTISQLLAECEDNLKVIRTNYLI